MLLQKSMSVEVNYRLGSPKTSIEVACTGNAELQEESTAAASPKVSPVGAVSSELTPNGEVA